MQEAQLNQTNKNNRREELIKSLNLELNREGGYFKRVYCSENSIVQVQDQHKEQQIQINQQNLKKEASSIFYMLTKDQRIGHFNKNKSTILHYFIEGDPLKYYLLKENGELSTITLGKDISKGHQLFMEVPGGIWKATELEEGGEFGLISEVVVPAFYYKDCELGDRDMFKEKYPEIFEKYNHFIPEKALAEFQEYN